MVDYARRTDCLIAHLRRWAPAYGALVSTLLFCVFPAGIWAQESAASRNLPVDHWAYEYVKRLRVRGHLENLNPLVQPYRRMEIAQGLARIEPGELSEPEASWMDLLYEELRPELDRIEGRERGAWGMEISAGARAASTERLDVLRPFGDEGFWPRASVAGWLETGVFVAETRVAGDDYFDYDPDGIDPGMRRGGRTDNAYVSAVFPFGSVTFGRLKRNWFGIGTPGLLVSSVSTPYPQLGFELRAGRFALRSFTGELETIDERKRYIAGHRLDYESENLVLSFGESILFAGTENVSSFRFMNPAEFLFFDNDNKPVELRQNLMLDAQAWYRANGLIFYFEGLLDDIDVGAGDREDREAPLYALTLGARGVSFAPCIELGLEYQRASAWAYRTPAEYDRYSFLERGLGLNFSDYDRVTVSADVFTPVRGLQVTPVAEILRQGEGDFRDSIPPMNEYLASDWIFLGVKETTYRLGLRGRYQPNRFFWVSWDLGRNFVRNARHVEGEDISEFVALGEIGFKLDLPLRRDD